MNTTASTTPVFDQNYTSYQLNRGSLRRFIRSFYIEHARKLCSGATLDFGCGVGDLLSLLPPGSLGLEVNTVTVDHCRARGLVVDLYDPSADAYQLKDITANHFTTFMISHVLEHLDDADQVLRQLFLSCSRLGIKKFVIKVPGRKGYQSDHTHRTFINKDWFKAHSLLSYNSWKCVSDFHYPFNAQQVGNVFTHNEYTLVFENTDLSL